MLGHAPFAGVSFAGEGVQRIAATAIASAEQFGSPGLKFASQSISVSDEAIGAPTELFSLAAIGAVSDEAIEAATGLFSAIGISVASAEFFDAPAVSFELPASAIAPADSGEPAAAFFLREVSADFDGAVGTPTISGAEQPVIHPLYLGILASLLRARQRQPSPKKQIYALGISSAEGFGLPNVILAVKTEPVASALAHGKSRISLRLTATEIRGGAKFGKNGAVELNWVDYDNDFLIAAA